MSAIRLTTRTISTFFREIVQLLSPFRRFLVRAFVWIIILNIAALGEPYIVKYVVDGITSRNTFIEKHLEWIAITMFATLILVGFVQIKKGRSIYSVMCEIERDLPIVCGKKLLALPLSYHQTENTALLIGKVVRGVGKTMDLVAVLLYEIVPLVLQTTIVAVILVRMHITIILILIPVVLVFGWITTWAKMRMAKYRMERHDKDSEADELLGQAVTNVMTTQAFAQTAREMQMVTTIRDAVRRLAYWEFGQNDRTDVIRNGLVSFGRVGVIYLCARAVFGSTLSMGSLVFISQMTEKIFNSCYRIGAVFDRMMEATEPVMRMTEVLAEKETVTDPIVPVEAPARFTGRIEFSNVTYRYNNRRQSDTTTKPALDQMNLVIDAGETIGIVGESGGGKSTLAKLIMRLTEDPTQGFVTIDGIDIRSLRLNDLRSRIGMVPQEVEIYDLSIAENIAYGRPNASRKEIITAARDAYAHDFIEECEHGYDEIVGNRGLRLSGGQRQRIGLARALLIDPSILILDEATSHVDVVSEAKIQTAIDRFRHGRTLIIIAHRLSTVANADRIVVVEKGQVKEIGTHAELMRHNGIYGRLVSLQSRVEARL